MPPATLAAGGGAGAGGPGGFPRCRRCGRGELVPPSDFGGQGAEVRSKAWVCTHPARGFDLKIRHGEVFVNEPVTDASGRGVGPRPVGPPPGPRQNGLTR